MTYKIGIIGMGFVGTAVREGLMDKYEIYTADLNPVMNKSYGHPNHHPCNDNVTAFLQSDITFICVNTPMNKDGSCNTSIVSSVLAELDAVELNIISKKVIVIKSTITPGYTQWANDYTNPNISILFNPEFLTEANFIEEFKNQGRIVLGGPKDAVDIVKDMYSKIFTDGENLTGYHNIDESKLTRYLLTDSTTAEMVKYVANTFFATKVSFFNEMKQICDKLGVDYDEMISYVIHDKRIGQSHYKVPNNGNYGFSGSCFPKDLNAIKFLGKQLGVKTTMLDATWEKNLEVRPERDWENLKGRAVTDDETPMTPDKDH
jgi:UDPglucose 6-dehydrogenase